MLPLKRILLRKIALVIRIWLVWYVPANAQNIIRNGTFIPPQFGDINPNGWLSCPSETYWDDVTTDASYSPRNGDPVVFPKDGSSLVKMRARGYNYAEDNPMHPKLTREYLVQKLTTPLEKRTCYKLHIFLCYNSHEWFVDPDPNEVDVAYPMNLDIMAGNDTCNQPVLLLKSELINNTEWKEFSYQFSTYEATYEYLRLQINWDTVNVRPRPYNGMMLLDSVVIEKVGTLTDTATENVYFKGDNKTVLRAPEGESYAWSPADNVEASHERTTKIKAYNALDTIFTVQVSQALKCAFAKSFVLKFSCDTLYPVKLMQPIRDIYYKPNQLFRLTATAGQHYLWQPADAVSDVNSQQPYLLKFPDEPVVATIWDTYECSFLEQFNIVANCDTLNPRQLIVQLDTTLNNESSFQLIPRYGVLEGVWSPAIGLSDTKSQTPFVSPVTSIQYTATLKDVFDCLHQEVFKIAFELNIPNVITPNGDGLNDCLTIPGLPENTSVSIFSKTGLLVYQTHHYLNRNCWDGLDMRGERLDPGTYWIVVENKSYRLAKKAFVLLVR